MMKLKKVSLPFVLIIPLVILFACNEQIVFEENLKVDPMGWNMEERLVFELEINDSTALHDIFLNVRNNTDYPFSNLYLFFQTRFPDGRVFRDTIEMMLADREGKWTGRGFGRIKSNSFHFRKDVWFPVEGLYEFKIQHAMRNENIKGLSDVGIRIEKK